MRAVACINNAGFNLAGQQGWCTRLRVPHHQQVCLHGVKGGCGIKQCFTLVYRRLGDRHVNNVCPQTLARKLKRGAGAGAVFKKQVNERAAPQHVPRNFAGAVEQGIAFGQIKQRLDLVWRHALQAKQMLGVPAGKASH